MNLPIIELEHFAQGDCLQEKINMANQGTATPQELEYLDRRLDNVSPGSGKIACEAAGCSSACTLTKSEDGEFSIDMDRLHAMSNNCRRLADALSDFLR